MASLSVGTSPVNLGERLGPFGRKVTLIQNLGPGVLYMDSSDSVSPSEGFEIAVGGVYETNSGGAFSSLFLVSASTSDVRVVSV